MLRQLIPPHKRIFVTVVCPVVFLVLHHPKEEFLACWPRPLIVGFRLKEFCAIIKLWEPALRLLHKVVKVLVLKVEDNTTPECAVAKANQPSIPHQLNITLARTTCALVQNMMSRARHGKDLASTQRLPNHARRDDVNLLVGRHGVHFILIRSSNVLSRAGDESVITRNNKVYSVFTPPPVIQTSTTVFVGKVP